MTDRPAGRIAFFLPNGIGDILMAVPALRRLTKVYGAEGIVVVVRGAVHAGIVRQFVDAATSVLVRHDGGRFSQLRLWWTLKAAGVREVWAPNMSSKLLHLFFFLSLAKPVRVPSSFRPAWARIYRSRYSLESFPGHQVNFFVQFCHEADPRVDSGPVDFGELKPPSLKRMPLRPATDIPVAIAVAISCNELERHKIPSPAFFSRLVNALAQKIECVVTVYASQSDTPLVDAFIGGLTAGLRAEVIYDLPVADIVNRLCDSHVGICGTTGQGHMMAVAGLPLLLVAGVTNPWESGPYVRRAAVLAHGLRCGPCYQEAMRFGCGRRRCMEELDIDQGVSLLVRLAREPGFGSGWLGSQEKRSPVPIAEIRSLHRLPLSQWGHEGIPR